MNVHLAALVPSLDQVPNTTPREQRVTCTPDCQASSRVKREFNCTGTATMLEARDVHRPWKCWPHPARPHKGSELQTMPWVAQIASDAAAVLLGKQMLLILWPFSVWGGSCCSGAVFIFLMTVKPLRMMLLCCYSSVYPLLLLSCAAADHLGPRTLLLCQ